MDLLELLNSNKIKEAVNYIQNKGKKNIENYTKEYENDRKQRELQVGRREDKKLVDGKINTVAKIAIPKQRSIVLSAASFLFGSPIKLTHKEGDDNTNEDAFNAISNLWDDLRMDSLLLDFCKTVKSETESTIIFFPVKKEDEKDIKIKARVLSNKNGKVYPYIDAFGDMTAFGWEYPTKENDKDVVYMYVWTSDTTYIFRKEKDWELAENGKIPNLFGKIPVVYLSQTNPEWYYVQGIIDRYEMSVSKLADTNDEHSDPKYILKGKAGLLPDKDTTAITIEIVETAAGNIISGDVGLLEWNSAPESKKLEFETLKGLVHELTDTPDLSFDNVKGLGTVSGLALKLMFLGPILKSKRSEGDYQVVISRIINILKAGLKNVTKNVKGDLDGLRIKSTFTSVLPENLKETIEILSEALGGKPIISQKTAIKHNPLVENLEEEIQEIESENDLESKNNLGETVDL